MQIPRTMRVVEAEIMRRKATQDTAEDAKFDSFAGRPITYEDGTIGLYLVVKMTDGTSFGVDSVERFKAVGGFLIPGEDGMPIIAN